MLNFKEELAKFEVSPMPQDIQNDLSGDEVQDILDIAEALLRERRQEVRREARG